MLAPPHSFPPCCNSAAVVKATAAFSFPSPSLSTTILTILVIAKGFVTEIGIEIGIEVEKMRIIRILTDG